MPDRPSHLPQGPERHGELMLQLRVVGAASAPHLEQGVGPTGSLVGSVFVPRTQTGVRDGKW